MEAKILHVKVILFLLLQCMLMFAVNSVAPMCQPGEVNQAGAIFTSGWASQCSDLGVPITTRFSLLDS